ncbi:DUF927 domain-containing protein [Aliiroseovarius sp. S1123]|uniref:DUF927 domain-containing protein n=1 Tax=Aliiroseovarius sp. S1123 TaxID=2926404 RepID=UPI001FF626EF|nr:DUF927 domain-containing protein [Aliiroseovarius sp. S1123]MCK0169577.1 DUF927 domain-containing protein [Aliiroseovarius sp. S1123]
MTDQTITTRPGSDIKNVVSFPVNASSLASAAPRAIMEPIPDGMPSDYSLNADGIYQLRLGEDDDLVSVRICSPLIVKGMCRWPKGGGWGRVVAVEDPDGNWNEVILEARDVSKKTAAALNPLFDRGLELAPIEKAAQRVAELVATWRPQARYLRSDRLGWADKSFSAFTLGDGRVLGEGLVVTDAVSDDVAAAMHTRGSMESWRKAVAEPCVGNPLMILALSHAFTGPLLSVLGRDGGGFHLRGVSSRGKSTLLGVAASVWGAPSYMQSWRGTDNGIEGIAAACNDSLLVLDELHQVDPSVAGEIVYMLANGRGKMRSSSNGRTQRTLRWTVPVLSSGELSLEEHMASGGRTMYAGQDIRLIDLAADVRLHGAFDCLHGESDGRAFAERIKQAGQENYGVAGPAFVERLMKNPDKLEGFSSVVSGYCRMWNQNVDLPPDGQVQRVMVRFALAAVAGETATRFGLTGWPRGAAQSAAFELFRSWLDARDGATRAEINVAVERTQSYVLKNLERFAVVDTGNGDPIDGWRDEGWFYITPECWRRIHQSDDAVEIARIHKAAGHLKTQKGDGLQFKLGRAVPGRPNVYAVRASALVGVVPN